ncbi:hypothetical protein O988_03295 [Pseudogymnoascus sp. VKM F-3808]|nr:hypothetical protein O988_03295 [Pseudogymnoascus sp. VKM F-3808]
MKMVPARRRRGVPLVGCSDKKFYTLNSKNAYATAGSYMNICDVGHAGTWPGDGHQRASAKIGHSPAGPFILSAAALATQAAGSNRSSSDNTPDMEPSQWMKVGGVTAVQQTGTHKKRCTVYMTCILMCPSASALVQNGMLDMRVYAPAPNVNSLRSTFGFLLSCLLVLLALLYIWTSSSTSDIITTILDADGNYRGTTYCCKCSWCKRLAQCMLYPHPSETYFHHFTDSSMKIMVHPINSTTKDTNGLPPTMVFLWAIAAVPFGTYAIVQQFNTPLQIQPQLLCTLSLISWVQILVYGNGWSWFKASIYGITTAAIFGGAQAVLILTLRPLYNRGINYPMIIVGVIASILVAVGLLPPYYEMWKRRGRVVGISLWFIFIDLMGAFFSLMALVAQHEFDILGGVLYIAVIILELGILISHAIWLVRTRSVRRAAALEGKTFDDVRGEKAHAGTPWKFSERRFRLKDVRKGGKCGIDVDLEMAPERVHEVETSTPPSSTTASSIIKSPAMVADGGQSAV